MAQSFVERRGLDIDVEPDTTHGRHANAALLRKNDARTEGPSFEEWLASEDAATLPF
jgi:hypothetical protein